MSGARTTPPLTERQAEEGFCCRIECCGGGSWCCSHADVGHRCDGDERARAATTEPSEEAITAEARRLHDAECGCSDLLVESHASWREYARVSLLSRASSGSDDNPHESDGTAPEACAYCGDAWPCAGSGNGSSRVAP